MWSFIYFGVFIFIIGTVFLNRVFYDLLIKIERNRFPLDWFKDGKPNEMFQSPSDIPTFGGTVSRHRLMKKWIFQKPKWIVKDNKAKTYYKYFRLTGAVYLSTILLSIGSFIVIFLLQP